MCVYGSLYVCVWLPVCVRMADVCVRMADVCVGA